MEIPKLLHEILINSYEQELSKFPLIKEVRRRIRYEDVNCFKFGSHTIKKRTAYGQKIELVYNKQQSDLIQLETLNSSWKALYNEPVSKIELNVPYYGQLRDALYQKLKDEALNYRNEDKKHAAAGKYFRSKSEAKFAEIYRALGIDFKYETHFDYSYYPDFAASPSFINGFFFHEHFGKMNSIDYQYNAAVKIKEYVNMGLIPGRDILFTFESDNHECNTEEFLHLLTALIAARLNL